MKNIGYILVIVVVAAITWFQLKFRPEPLPVYRNVPEFALVERSGAVIHSKDLLGKVWLADFFYSTCPGPCPMISTNVAGLQRSISQLSPDTRTVSISLDPERDTPEVLKKYAEHYEASSDRWLFLTGEKDRVQQIASDGFLVSFSRTGDENQPIIHGTQLALVDRHGRIRAFYDGTGLNDPEKVIADMRRLLQEK